ncbi:Restriction endonuclease S subunit (HsdS) [Fructobacillus cardui]|uniref:restriction endonuclease subunit S n=1 Tax=Fructobacillus cardui TaxID=2893170 RepID=UPI002D988D50|nr:Restriction endonuclease S subunit (HsdS) [Fructobacillus cardui]
MKTTTEWSSFKLIDLFQVKGTKTTPKKKIDFDEYGRYPYITTSAINNGVYGYSESYTENGGVLTVDSAVRGVVFYQSTNFLASDHVEKLIPKFEITSLRAQFFITILNKNIRKYGYSYDHKRSQTKLKQEEIELPVTSSGLVNFKYIDNYMSSMQETVQKKIKRLTNLSSNEKTINTEKWNRFKLYESLFTVVTGNKFDFSKMTFKNPHVNFVGRSGLNNGVGGLVDEIKNVKPFPAGSLTVALGGSIGSSFIQTEDFYTSQNVAVLVPKIELSDLTKQFIATMIRRESDLYYSAFVNELNKHINTDFTVLLPVTSEGKIDFEYMEAYMAKINRLMYQNQRYFQKVVKGREVNIVENLTL